MAKSLRLGVVYDFRNPPEIGMLNHQSLYAAIMDQVAWLDGLGLDLVWFTEHHFVDDGYLPSWIPVAAAMAARTKHVRFSCDVCLLPFNHPIRLAEDLAVLDNISGGRVEIGVGMGYAPHEFRGFGLPVSRRVSLTDEGIEVLQRAFTGEKFSFDGKRYNFQDVKITPGYVQPGGPPLWIAAMAEAGALRAARFGTNLLPQGERARSLDPWLAKIADERARSGRPSHRHHPLLPGHRRPRARLGGGAGRRAAAHGGLQPVPRGGRRPWRRRRHHRGQAHPADLGGRQRRPLRRRAVGLHRGVRPHRPRDLGRAARHAARPDEPQPGTLRPRRRSRVEVSQTPCAVITSLTDPLPIAATPAGAYRMAAATVAVHQALRIAGAAVAAAIGAEPARISATALRDTATASIRAGQGATVTALTAAIGIISRDITRHPLRFVTAWRPGRHYPGSPSRKSGPAKAATPSRPRPGCSCSRCPSPRPGRAAERAASSLTRDPAIPARHRRAGMPGMPRCRKRPQEHRLPRTGASAGPPARTRLTESNRNSSRTAPTRPVADYKT